MKKVYLIMVGEYSDRHCVGFCTTEQEAVRICAIKNGFQRSNMCYGDYEYEEVECLDGRIAGDVETGYSFCVSFAPVDGGWHMYHCDGGVVSVEHRPYFYERRDGRISVTVWTKDDDEDKAKKIAQDSLYTWLSEREEHDKSFVED